MAPVFVKAWSPAGYRRITLSRQVDEPIDITGDEKIFLKVDFDGSDLQFYYALNNEPSGEG